MSNTSTSTRAGPLTLAGRRRALEALVERERLGVVTRLGEKLTHVDAEDLYQEACLRALERLSQQQHPTQLRAWFSTVLRSVVSRSVTLQRSAAPPRLRDGPAAEAAAVPCRCGIDALATLPEQRQQLLRRAVLEGRTTLLLAREQGTTPNNIRVRLHRARAQLRTRWERRCGACISGDRGLGCACISVRDARAP